MIKKLDELTNNELKQIRQRNKLEKGLIFVHPYFVNSGVEAFENIIKRLKKHEIIIIAESHPFLNELKSKIATIKPKNGIILLYTTKLDNGTPVMGWQKLITRLRLLGATKIVVGGNNFGKTVWTKESITAKEWLGKKMNSQDRTARRSIKNNPNNLFLEQCAGFTSAKLTASGKFKVRTLRHRK